MSRTTKPFPLEERYQIPGRPLYYGKEMAANLDNNQTDVLWACVAALLDASETLAAQELYELFLAT